MNGNEIVKNLLNASKQDLETAEVLFKNKKISSRAVFLSLKYREIS